MSRTSTGTETVKFYSIKGGAALLTKESWGLAFVTPIKIAEKGVYFPNGVALSDAKRIKSLAAAGKQVIRIQAADGNTFDKAASVGRPPRRPRSGPPRSAPTASTWT